MVLEGQQVVSEGANCHPDTLGPESKSALLRPSFTLRLEQKSLSQILKTCSTIKNSVLFSTKNFKGEPGLSDHHVKLAYEHAAILTIMLHGRWVVWSSGIARVFLSGESPILTKMKRKWKKLRKWDTLLENEETLFNVLIMPTQEWEAGYSPGYLYLWIWHDLHKLFVQL